MSADFAYCKLEIFIPESHLEELRQALRSVDAGHIGNYDCCLSYSPVTGCWRPLEGTAPYLGSTGALSEEPELKVEVTCRTERADETVEAVKRVHPYEEPVINVIPLYRTGLSSSFTEVNAGMTAAEEKRLLRAEVRNAERALSPEYKRAADAGITAGLLALGEFREARTVFCFVGGSREIDTRAFLQAVLEQGRTLCVPLCTGPGQMEARVIRSLGQLREGRYGLLEPPPETPKLERGDIGLSVIPCVSCDRAGVRLGQGGGYYDRFFASGTERTALVCRRRLMRPSIPREPHDLAFPLVVTEEGAFLHGSKI